MLFSINPTTKVIYIIIKTVLKKNKNIENKSNYDYKLIFIPQNNIFWSPQ